MIRRGIAARRKTGTGGPFPASANPAIPGSGQDSSSGRGRRGVDSRPDRIARTRSSRLGTATTLALILATGNGCQPAVEAPSHARAAAPTGATAVPPGFDDQSTIRFRDVSDSTGITFTHCSGKSPERHFPTNLGSGVAMIDFDHDGWLDLYFATTRNLPLESPNRSQGNKLYRNRGDGTFEDVTQRAGVGFRGFTHGVAVGDVDGNGYPDLYLTNLGPNVLYLNRGDGTFVDATAGSGAEGLGWSTGAAMLDYDGDGDLDLYVSCYGQWTYGDQRPFFGNLRTGERAYCPPTVITPARHLLLRNRGGGVFEDVSSLAGVLRHDGRGLGVLAADLNRDGRTDLYVANDMSPNFLFLNRGDGTFVDATEVSGAAVNANGMTQASMGVDAEDVTGDGNPELVVTNFRGEYSTVYRNLSGGCYQDVSAWAGVVPESQLGVGWGCGLVDFDNDGWPDLLVVNGHVDDNLPSNGDVLPQAEPAKVWSNQGDGRFRLVRDPGPFFAVDHVARGAAFGDLDNDGDMDVVISLMDRRPAVLLNESPRRSWIRFELMTGTPGRPAIGAVVEVHTGDRVIYRQVKGGGSYLSANDPRLLVGLGSAARVERVVIHWPSGACSTLVDPAPGRSHRVRDPREGRPPTPHPGVNPPPPSARPSRTAAGDFARNTGR